MTFVKSCVFFVAKAIDDVLSDKSEKQAKVFKKFFFLLDIKIPSNIIILIINDAIISV